MKVFSKLVAALGAVLMTATAVAIPVISVQKAPVAIVASAPSGGMSLLRSTDVITVRLAQ